MNGEMMNQREKENIKDKIKSGMILIDKFILQDEIPVLRTLS